MWLYIIGGYRHRYTIFQFLRIIMIIVLAIVSMCFTLMNYSTHWRQTTESSDFETVRLLKRTQNLDEIK